MKITYSNTAKLPTTYGEFNMISFKQQGSEKEHCLIYMGDLAHGEDVMTRVHSECLTGDIFTSIKCDCGEQLHESLRKIAARKRGVLIYLKQEGRGIGLFNKVNAYALQDLGLDTIQANHSLGFATDLRDFTIAVKALHHLQIRSIVLLSNNPEKIKVFENTPITVSEVMPLRTDPTAENRDYLNVKKAQLHHLL